MYNNHFGSVKVYPMLEYISNNLPLCEESKRKYLTSFINQFNATIKYINGLLIKPKMKKYFLYLIRKDYENKTDALYEKYDVILISHLKNFIHAKTKY